MHLVSKEHTTVDHAAKEKKNPRFDAITFPPVCVVVVAFQSIDNIHNPPHCCLASHNKRTTSRGANASRGPTPPVGSDERTGLAGSAKLTDIPHILT